MFTCHVLKLLQVQMLRNCFKNKSRHGGEGSPSIDGGEPKGADSQMTLGLLQNCRVFGVNAHHFLQQRVMHFGNAIPKKKAMPRTRAHSIETRTAGKENNNKKSCLWAMLAAILCARKYLMPDSYMSFACCWDLGARMHKHPRTYQGTCWKGTSDEYVLFYFN